MSLGTIQCTKSTLGDGNKIISVLENVDIENYMLNCMVVIIKYSSIVVM